MKNKKLLGLLSIAAVTGVIIAQAVLAAPLGPPDANNLPDAEFNTVSGGFGSITPTEGGRFKGSNYGASFGGGLMGVYGNSAAIGVQGDTTSDAGVGVIGYGKSLTGGTGVSGYATGATGTGGYFSGGLFGMKGESLNGTGGYFKGGLYGMEGNSLNGIGGYFSGGGLYGLQGSNPNGTAVYGSGKLVGMKGNSKTGFGVYGTSDALPGYFENSSNTAINVSLSTPSDAIVANGSSDFHGLIQNTESNFGGKVRIKDKDGAEVIADNTGVMGKTALTITSTGTAASAISATAMPDNLMPAYATTSFCIPNVLNGVACVGVNATGTIAVKGVATAGNADVGGQFTYSGGVLNMAKLGTKLYALDATGAVNVTGTGRVTSSMTAASYITSSDARLKDVLGNFNKGLDEVLKLNPIIFKYKQGNAESIDSAATHYGFSAQEVQKVIPEAVSKDKQGYLSVEIMPFLTTFVNAFKDVDAAIENWSHKMEELSNRVDQLQKDNADLKARLDRLEAKVR